MVFLIILGVLVLIIVGIMLIPIGADIGYEEGKIHVSAKAAGVLIQLFPRKKKADSDKPKAPKKKKEKKSKKPKEEKKEEEKPKEKKLPDFTLDEVLDLLKAVLRGIAHFGGKIKVDRFVLHLTVAGYDPYNVAMAYGKINAWLSGVAPLCKKLNAKNSDVWTDLDFTDNWPHMDFAIAMSFRIGQLFGMAFRIGFGALKVLLRRKKRIKQEKKAAAANPPSDANPPAEIENTNQNKQDEERMAANG